MTQINRPTAPPRLSQLSPLVGLLPGLNPSIFTGEGTNTFLVGRAGGRPIWIDAASGGEAYGQLAAQTLAARRAAGLPEPLMALFTHGHPDHIGGAARLKALLPEVPFFKIGWPQADGPSGVAFHPLADGQWIEGDGVRLQVVHTPGHAPDHACLWLEEERALFSGDMVLGQGSTLIPYPSGDMGAYLAGLERLARLEPSRIYPGHGPTLNQPVQAIRLLIQRRLEREREIVDQLREGGKRLEQLQMAVYGRYPQGVQGLARQTLLAHLAKLMKEAAVLNSGGEEGPYYLTRL